MKQMNSPYKHTVPFLGLTAKNTVSGFSLIEMLVSAVILSIGLLGLASLHFEGLKKGNESFYKTMASIQADDLIDRMRANRDAVDQGFYDNNQYQSQTQNNLTCLGGVNNGTSGTYDSSVNQDGTVSEGYASMGADVQFTNAGCDAQQIARQDMYEWQQGLAQALPGGDSTVCRSSNPGPKGSTVNCDGAGNLMVININWRSKDGGLESHRVSFKP